MGRTNADVKLEGATAGGENPYVIPATTVNVRVSAAAPEAFCSPCLSGIVVTIIAATCFTVGVFTDRLLVSYQPDAENVEIVVEGSEDPDSSLTEATDTSEEGSYLTGDTQPNIIILMADDLGWSDISHNDGQFSTPTIDSVLQEGVEFTKFYSHALCTPSRMAFLTGRFAWRLGTQYPEVIHGLMSAHVPTDELTYAEVTRAQGYENYYVGRWGVGYASWGYTPLGRGWDKFYGYFGAEGGYYNHSTDHFQEWRGVYDMWDMYEPAIEGNGTYSEDLFFEKTVEYLNEAKESGKPFTLTYASQTGHDPISDESEGSELPPKTWSECEGIIDNYVRYHARVWLCNKVKYLDMIWGQIIQTVKDLDMWDNTVILMTSDNGALPYFNTNGLSNGWGCNWPLRGSKVTHLEGALRVWAGMTGGLVPEELRGTTHDGLTHITDFAATTMRLSMSDTTVLKLNNEDKGWNLNTKALDGKNLWNLESHDLIVHNVYPQYLPDWIFAMDMDYAVTDGEWKFWSGISDEAKKPTGWYNFPGLGMITETTDAELWEQGGGNCTHGCLFHLATDPNESTDVSADYPEIVDYFEDVVQSIWRGGLDDDYHPGQNYLEDWRGWNSEAIMRPYLTQVAKADYEARKDARTSLHYNYEGAPITWSDDLTIYNTYDSSVERSVAAGRGRLSSTPIYEMFDGGGAVDPMIVTGALGSTSPTPGTDSVGAGDDDHLHDGPPSKPDNSLERPTKDTSGK